MLIADITVNNRHEIGSIRAVRAIQHRKLKSHFYYNYEAWDETKRYRGQVLHNYNSGPFALLQKITKSVVAQQKAERLASK